MKTFIDDVLNNLFEDRALDLTQTAFILPSKRAGGFLKNGLKARVKATCFAPQVWSIEEFITEVSKLETLDNINTLFAFYGIYKTHTPKEEREDFDTFYGWAQTLIYDFNEIDRYLIDTDKFFNYLSDIKNLEHWSMDGQQTELIKKYLEFWKTLPQLHLTFKKSLLKERKAYQGLVYRKASENITHYLDSSTKQFIFIGFNALNNAEQHLLQTVLEQNRGQVYWDIDAQFFNDPQHHAGLFMRHYHKNWPCYSGHSTSFNWVGNHYNNAKKIECIGVPKNIGQAKYVAEILEKEELNNTALVLSDEGLLSPIVNSLPPKVDQLNITMGLSLGQTPLAALFELLFKIQQDTKPVLYHKYVLDVLNHPAINNALGKEAANLQQTIIEKNRVFIALAQLTKTTTPKTTEIITCCFSKQGKNSEKFLEHLITLTELLRPKSLDNHHLEAEYLYHFNRVFKTLKNLLDRYRPATNIKALRRLYNDILQTESIDLNGSPYEGLQIMGMLETRVLDFDTVIITSVNEGLLPGGKSSNSFIPYDLKKEYGLPTYREKDAVYTYHFYRLLQRAKKVYLLYNTDFSGLNAGEKSRFITQLEVEKTTTHQLEQKLINPQSGATEDTLQEIPKTPAVLVKLKKLAAYGFSPSALTTYIRNPLDFYKRYVLSIKEKDDVEEVVAANTLGTVVHNTLETFYKPFINKTISAEDIKSMYNHIDSEVRHQFATTYKEAPINEGKNLIIFEIAKRYIKNYLRTELKLVENNTLEILQIEDGSLRRELKIDALDFPVYLRGKVDRIDRLNDEVRIVDYKTGKTKSGDLKIKEWALLTADYKYSKAFQILCYSSLIEQLDKFTVNRAGIISFKNLKEGFMPFGKKNGKKITNDINSETLAHFHEQLGALITEIMDPDIPFIEKEV